MKKTFTINISGSVFHIDEDAYEKLQNYLQMLARHFGSDADGREIIQDIESRIAELFSQKMQTEAKDVIIDLWVDEVIARMGKPEDFMEENEEATVEEPQVASETKIKRRLYRDPENRVLGGVCAGMGAYFDIDKVLMRIIFFLLFFVIGPFNILLYIILWIAVPVARTTAQKLEMRGREATVSNIEKSIKEEVKEVKESYKRFRSSDTYNKGKEQVSRLGDVSYSTARVVLKVLVVIIGVLLILAALIGLAGFIISMIVGHSVFASFPIMGHWGADVNVPEIANFFISSGSLTLLLIAIGLLVCIPLFAILFIGTKMVFQYKSNNRLVILAGLGVWVIALIAVVSISAGQINNYSKRASVSQSQIVNCQDCNTIYFELGADNYESDEPYDIDLDRMKVVSKNGTPLLIGTPRLDIEKSNTGEFAVIVRKKSRGDSQETANKHVEDIIYNFSQQDSTLYFDPYFTLGQDSRWLNQEVDIVVKVPEGKMVYLTNEMSKIIFDIENLSNTWDGDMVGKYWLMTADGLQETNQPNLP